MKVLYLLIIYNNEIKHLFFIQNIHSYFTDVTKIISSISYKEKQGLVEFRSIFKFSKLAWHDSEPYFFSSPIISNANVFPIIRLRTKKMDKRINICQKKRDSNEIILFIFTQYLKPSS